MKTQRYMATRPPRAWTPAALGTTSAQGDRPAQSLRPPATLQLRAGSARPVDASTGDRAKKVAALRAAIVELMKQEQYMSIQQGAAPGYVMSETAFQNAHNARKGYTTCNDLMNDLLKKALTQANEALSAQQLGIELKDDYRNMRAPQLSDNKQIEKLERMSQDALYLASAGETARPQPGDILLLDKLGGRKHETYTELYQITQLHPKMQALQATLANFTQRLDHQIQIVEAAQRRFETAEKLANQHADRLPAGVLLDYVLPYRLAFLEALRDLRAIELAQQQYRQQNETLIAQYEHSIRRMERLHHGTQFHAGTVLAGMQGMFAHVCFFKELIEAGQDHAPYEVWRTYDGGRGAGNQVMVVTRKYYPGKNFLTDAVIKQNGQWKPRTTKAPRWLKGWIRLDRIVK